MEADDTFDLLADDERHEIAPLDNELDADELEGDYLPDGGSLESHIDDPIRMYLMQMGEIPMLSRPDEIASASRIPSFQASRSRKERMVSMDSRFLRCLNAMVAANSAYFPAFRGVARESRQTPIRFC